MIEIKDKQDCTGCTTCANVCPKSCIEMRFDEEGFKYPHVDTSLCIECNLCVKTCPILNPTANPEPIKIYALKNKNSKEQSAAASGGVFSEISKHIISQKGVVVGAGYNPDFSVSHSIAHTDEECLRFRGSKYQQSNLDFLFKETKQILANGTIVLFSGTPCQISGLKHFLRKDYPNLYTCDIICHGVPSPKVFQAYLKFIEKKYHRRIKSINMRDKTIGWTHSGIRIDFTDGFSIFRNKETSLFNCMYSVHYATRPSCHKCQFANFHREGDITIGDFWGIQKSHPDFFDNNGVSLALINTAKGEILFNAIRQNFHYISSNQHECIQHNLYTSAKPSPARFQFMRDFNRYDFQTLAVRYMDYGKINQFKSFMRRGFKKLHLPIPNLIKSTIIK